MSSSLLAYTRDTILAQRSGYHVIADYLAGSELVVAPRGDPSNPLQLLATRLLRRLAFSRWYTGGSFAMERQIRQRLQRGFTGPVHLLWCDRDMGFVDFFLNPSRHPLIGTFHQCDDELGTLIRRPSALRKFAAIILMSETQRPFFRSHGVSDKRLHRIRHGVDVDHFTPGPAAPPATFTVLSVGGTRRDFGLMCGVAEALLQSDPSLRFEIVGPADKGTLFAGMPNVRYSSGLSDEALLDHYRNASCFLHLAENATANNAMLEALACGLPVVSQRIGGIPEYLSASCSILCQPGDQAAVVHALRSLASSTARQIEARQAARAQALTLDWRIVASQTRQLYQSLS